MGTRTTWQLGFPERAQCGAASKVLLHLEAAQGASISILNVLSIVQQQSYDTCHIFYSGLKSSTIISVVTLVVASAKVNMNVLVY